MNSMVPGLAGGKMSASDPNSKIDLLDTAETVKTKLKKALCAPTEIEGNGVISFIEYVIFPISELANGGKGKGVFHIERDEKFGGNADYANIDDLKRDYAADKIFPADLKRSLEIALNALLDPIRKEFDSSSEWKAIAEAAYPSAAAEGADAGKPKKKKEKKLGTGYVLKKKGGETTDGGSEVEGVKKVEDALAGSAEEALGKLNVDGAAA